ncbi:MAG: nucleotidyltransferase substrate binding protein [Thiobacillaceae bacterium]|nr:nucleotidyltransferase substrate binding protein [Thiobacillaceae bacterium]MCX7673827.1 nucleotidyltransferase substrate binding protein [Thiobacillaceae bacterium]MDW8323585.1 nucleotidyltransferase substrate binding protein [Burkholderiales bacterium]
MKVGDFTQALHALAELVALDREELARSLDARLLDAVENGMAQKFEYTVELCWKALKEALREREGLDAASPKKAVKAWYLTGHLTEDDYLALLAAIDDRNRLSHVYSEHQLRDILARLPNHVAALQRTLASLQAAD